MDKMTPEEVLLDLKVNADKRRCKSLDILNDVLKKYSERGGRDFSLTTIGKLSMAEGGPREQSMRNATGSAFKALIEAWAIHSNGLLKKLPVDTSIAVKKNGPPKDEQILKNISDPAIRALVSIIIAEKNLAIRENRLLKSQTEFYLDKRENNSKVNALEIKTQQMLTDYEIEAIEHAISDDFMKKQGWITDDEGRVTSGRTRIYKAGYITGLSKILKKQ